MKTILVINPASNEAMTQRIDEALAGLRAQSETRILCQTVEEGPYPIASQQDVDAAAVSLRRWIENHRDADAYIVACYADPGLMACREFLKKPVFGIAQCGVLTALARGNRFGVIAMSDKSIPRHISYLRQIGVAERLAAERGLNLSVAEAESRERILARMTNIGESLRDIDGAHVLVIGCAGYGHLRTPLERALGIPVIDPTQAALGMALAALA